MSRPNFDRKYFFQHFFTRFVSLGLFLNQPRFFYCFRFGPMFSKNEHPKLTVDFVKKHTVFLTTFKTNEGTIGACFENKGKTKDRPDRVVMVKTTFCFHVSMKQIRSTLTRF